MATPRKSGNPAVRATAEPKRPAPGHAKDGTQLRITTADEWMASAEGQIVELPSGRCVRVRMPGIQAFISADLIPNELMPIILSAVQKHQPMEDKELDDLQRDPAMLIKLAITMDKIFAYCVTEPKFELVPMVMRDDEVMVIDESRKQPGVLYTDMASDDDKGYIFGVAVGGVRDLDTFRTEQAAALATLQTRQGMAVPTEPAAGTD